ncbi:hypothetical protein EZ428_06745 [Pedobacter frigiditerrae]|uniref:Uncharacterized protein n=1 Tax=Pedobacter frigiditerrae TaxID=2530452 RepID=A0A4R0N8B3_9SPHI|nr:hypothetical protein [Pedobacter frigiditerrae]TCC94464.1 hypothetical protein EZ428_06745 [Pedobacter frigiditerrae]
MKVIALSIIVLVSSIVLVTCKKVKPGIATSVSGFAIDSAKNKRLANASVVIYGCRINSMNGSRLCADSVIGAKTDLKGDFNMSFVSDGNYIGYDVEISYYDKNYERKNSVKLNPGVKNSVILSAIELSNLKLDLKILSNPIGEISVHSWKTSYFLKGTSNDVILNFKVYPNVKNDVHLIVWDPKIGRYRKIIENVSIGLLDTTTYQKIVQTTNDFPIN